MRHSFSQNGAQKYNGERSSLAGWFGTAQGAYVLGWELSQFDSAVDDVFGFRAVQVGLPEVDFLRQNRIPFRCSLALEPGAAIAADPLQLPIATQSVDLVALPHVLESHPNPHEVLREAERVLMPEGQVVISGFNTFSHWRRSPSARTRTTMGDETVEIYTDGACSGNPGPGGWGAILRYKGKERELWGGEAATTNNRMELLAVIRALEALKRPSQVRLYTDSLYVQKGISTWIHDWKRRNWRTADKKEVKNVDLWKELEELAGKHEVEWHWVRGHAGHPENERVDALANKGIPNNNDAPGSTGH